MVISERDSLTLRFRTCHLHDMMREICLFKAKEEKFLQITSSRPPTANFQSPVTSRRLVCQYPTTLDVERDIDNPKLRSLVVVQMNDFYCTTGWELSGSSCTRLELLRVLDLYNAKFKNGKLPSGIGKLIHLRYLSLECAEVSHLPSSLGNLKLLIYLNLAIRILGSIILVPNVLMEMKELRYLALPLDMRTKTKLELSNQVNLETLIHFSTENCSLEDLRGMVRLRTLSIKKTEETSMETVSALIGGLRHLENLRIDNKVRMEEDIVLDFVNLKALSLINMQMTRLPKGQHFPSRLTTLLLSKCHLEEDPMHILEKLLHLKEVYLWDHVFTGRRMVCSGGGFPQLQMLLLFCLKELEEWIVEEGSMPLLHTLNIRCSNLKEVPDGLRFLHSLKDLTVPMEWKERLSEGGADHDKVKHIPSIKY